MAKIFIKVSHLKLRKLGNKTAENQEAFQSTENLPAPQEQKAAGTVSDLKRIKNSRHKMKLLLKIWLVYLATLMLIPLGYLTAWIFGMYVGIPTRDRMIVSFMFGMTLTFITVVIAGMGGAFDD